MERIVWAAVVALAWASAQPVVWKKGSDGRLHVSVADIAGVHNVTVTVHGDSGGRETVLFIPHISADGTWRAFTDDITKNDVIHYVIEYLFSDTVHRVTGSHSFKKIWGACHPVWGSNSCVTHGTDNPPVMSALLRSSGHIRYGKVEVVAKLPKGDWLWPAIWMMPADNHYGGWPKSGEIDIMEATGNLHLRYPNGESVGADCDFATIHYGNARTGSGHARHGQKYRLQDGTTFADAYHTYWLDWTESHMTIGVDDHTVLTLNTPSQGFWNEAHLQGDNIWASGGPNAPFDKPFYVILNVAVGGNIFWDGYINTPYAKPWKTGASDQLRQFWEGRHQWLRTWHGEDTALKVRSVKMQQY